MDTQLDGRQLSKHTGWNIAAYVLVALSLAGLVWLGVWLFDVCGPPANSACWLGSPIPGHEASLAAAGALVGVAFVWAVAAAWRRQWVRGLVALVVAVVAVGLGRWWAGPQTPFSDAYLTGHHPLLVWAGAVGGAVAAAAIWVWTQRRSRIWAIAAWVAVGAMGLLLVSWIYGVSYLE